jgi:DDE superfamily endonuclease
MAPAGRVEALFKGREYDQEIIVLCVRWYLRYKLSTRDFVEMMAERGAVLVHTTILRWVQHYVPEFEKRWSRYARPVGGSWRCDETYIRVKGRWTYLYRAVDKIRDTFRARRFAMFLERLQLPLHFLHTFSLSFPLGKSDWYTLAVKRRARWESQPVASTNCCA